MNKFLFRTCAIWILVASPLLWGCASTNSIRDAPASAGEEQLFDVSYERIVGLVATLLPLLDLENVDKHSNAPQSTVFVGAHGITAASWGEVVRVIVTEIDATKTSVRVHWRSKFRAGIITSSPNWQEEIFSGIGEGLP